MASLSPRSGPGILSLAGSPVSGISRPTMKPARFCLAVAVLGAMAFLAPTTANAGPERVSSKEYAPAPMVEPEFSWTGFYIGGHLGGVWNNFDIGPFEDEVDVDQQFFEAEGPGPAFTNTNSGGFDGFDSEFFSFGGGLNGASAFDVGTDDSFIGGGQLGYQHQFGHFVVGVEGDFSRLSPRRSETFEASAQQVHFLNDNIDTSGIFFTRESLQSNTTYTATRRAEIEWQGSARARLGWASGKVHLYVTGGAAFAQVKSVAIGSATTDFFFNEEVFFDFPELSSTNGTNGPIGGPVIFNQFPIGTVTDTNVSSSSEVLCGWTGGGGGEVALNDKVSVGVEYRHTDLGSHTFNYGSTTGPVFLGPNKVDFQNDQVTVRFNILLSHFFGR